MKVGDVVYHSKLVEDEFKRIPDRYKFKYEIVRITGTSAELKWCDRSYRNFMSPLDELHR